MIVRKIYLLPNFVTTMNLFCGFYSVVASHKGEFLTAAWAIVAAAVFDLLDGRVARLAKATSHFGAEYDSLSDLVSFGLAPAFLVYSWVLEPFGRFGLLAAFLFTACGALRLARFNVNHDDMPSTYFQGLPIPGAAGMLATFVVFYHSAHFPEVSWLPVFSLGMILVLGSLMVSSIKFPSFKEFNWKSKASFGYLLVGVMVMILLAVRPEVTMFGVLFAYVGGSLVWNFVLILNPHKRPRPATQKSNSS